MRDSLPLSDPPLKPHQHWIHPSNGEPPYIADFTEFFEGCKREQLRGQNQRLWRSDIVGMPRLARDFEKLVVRLAYDKRTYKTCLATWRNVHRFLRERPDLPKIGSIADFTELHGKAYRQWLFEAGLGQSTYRCLKYLVDAYFLERYGRPAPLAARDKDKQCDIPEPDLRGLQRLSLVLRHEARAQKNMCAEGYALAKSGSDPRAGPGGWKLEENQAWLVNELTAKTLLNKQELIKAGGVNLRDKSVGGPTYLSPTQTVQASKGYIGKLRWFHPAKADTATFLWLFMLHTGFNLATTLDIDISVDPKTGRETWWQPSLQHDDHCVIAIFKERVNKWVFRPSKIKPEYHAYGIIRYMIDRTSGLRATAKARLKRLEEHNRYHPTNTAQAEILRLRQMTKSPWLYHSLADAGKVEMFESPDSGFLNSFIREVATSHLLVDDHPYLKTLVTTQSRDAMINFTHKRTGEVIITALAAQHADLASLRYYLARSSDRKRNIQAVNNMIDHVVEDIREKQILDPARIKIMRIQGKITVAQEARLTDLRQRTRLGMGCKEPRSPPKEVSPYHVEGEICRVQRCTGCIHGVVFPESVVPLAYTLADLHYEKRNFPLASWKGSSLEDEERSIVASLRLFDPEVVKAHYKDRMSDLERGRARSFNVYPSY